MNYWQIVLMVVVLAGGYGYSRWVLRRAKRSIRSPEGQEAILRFFESTGYRHVDRLHDGPAVQAELWARNAEDNYAKSGNPIQAARLSYRAVMRRDFDDVAILWTVGYESGKTLNQWTLELPRPARVRWRAITRVKGGGQTGPTGPRDIGSGDPEIDKVVSISGEDQEGVRQALAAPGLKDALLSLDYVDLSVDGRMVEFEDPSSRNQQAAMGGYVGTILASGNMASMGMSIPMHDHIASLMTLAAMASA